MLCALIWVSAPGLAWATPVRFTEARERAVRLAPLVQAAGKRIGIARAQVRVAGTLANPTLSVQSATRTVGLGTWVTVPLPLFGQRGTAVDAAEADVGVSARELSMAQNEARFFATVAWIELWAAQERAHLLDGAAADTEHLLAVTQERFDAGSVPRVDVVRARAGSARAKADLASAQASVRSAALRLTPFLGVEPSDDTELRAEGVIEYAAELPELPTLLRRQVEHPALRRDRAQISAADAHLRSEQRQRWPIVNVDIGANQFDQTDPGGPDVFGGLSFELPILNQRGGDIERAEAERALAESEAVGNSRLLRADLEAAYRDAQGALGQQEALHGDVVPALLEARKMTEEGYRSGRIDLLHLLDTQRALIESQLAEVDANAAFGRALAELERAAGVRLDAGGERAR
jgi:cobalt-zinc-cadmium efflux system outer membrane protein